MLRSGDQIGPYTLIKKIGRGAFGTVWLSERRTTITTTTAALKIPLDEDVDLETIRHEANLWVRASGHANVLPIIEANIYDGQIVIASEYAPDGSLEWWLKQHGGKAPSVEVAVEIISGVLAGLEHLHARGIIHRDLKPANILFQGNTPRLADFGISRVLKSTSQSSIVAGTPAYMAPEAFDGKRNEQTDIWSIGIILYQLLAGRLPFEQANITSLVGAILSQKPNPLPISVPSPLHEIVGSALAKDSRQRYQSAAEMRAALRNSSEPNRAAPHVIEPVIPIPTPLVAPVPPPSRRVNPKFAYLVIGLMSLLAVSVVIMWIKSDPNIIPTDKGEVPTNVSNSNAQEPARNQSVPPVTNSNQPPAPAPRGTWFVVLGSFPKNDRVKADQRLEYVRGFGYDATIIDTDKYPGLTSNLWAVVMGPYSKPYARNLAAKMRTVRPDAYIKSGQ